MKLDDLLNEARKKGISVSIFPENIQGREMLTLQMNGIPSQMVGFKLDEFMRDMATKVDDAVMSGLIVTQINITIQRGTKAIRDPSDYEKWQREQRKKGDGER